MPGTRISLHAPAAAPPKPGGNNDHTPSSSHGCRDARCSQRSSCSCSCSSCSHDELTAPWPVHPVESMRGPFQESIQEAMDSDQKIRDTLNAASRRLQLLELGDDEVLSDEYSSRWKQKPNAKFHPLWKLIAQISFGVHLLHQRIAKSDEEVIRILQTHVDDVDGFIEDTNADFDLAIKDIEERHDLLCMPLQHGRVFDRMLKSATFRNAIVEGNDIIEKIVFRTNRAMTRSLDDVKSGLDAVAELSKFLERLGTEWTNRDESMQGVYVAMQGNAEGWHCCFKTIQDRGEQLTKLLVTLGATVDDVSRRAGIASRKRVRSAQNSPQISNKSPDGKKSHVSMAPSTKTAKTSLSRNSLNKPLPPDPLLEAISADAVRKSAKSTPEPTTKASSNDRGSPAGNDSLISRRPNSKLLSLQAVNTDAIRQQRFTQVSYHTARSGPSRPQSKLSLNTPRGVLSPKTEPIAQEPACPPLTASDTTNSVESLSPHRSPGKAPVLLEPAISRSPLESNPFDSPPAHIQANERTLSVKSQEVTHAVERARKVDAEKSIDVENEAAYEEKEGEHRVPKAGPVDPAERKASDSSMPQVKMQTPQMAAYKTKESEHGASKAGAVDPAERKARDCSMPQGLEAKVQHPRKTKLEDPFEDNTKREEHTRTKENMEAVVGHLSPRPAKKRRSTTPSNLEAAVVLPHAETVKSPQSVSTLNSRSRDSTEVNRPTSFITAVEPEAKPSEASLPPRSMSAQSALPFGHSKSSSKYRIMTSELSVPSDSAYNSGSGSDSHAASSPLAKPQPRYKLMPDIREPSPTAMRNVTPVRMDSPVDTALPSWADTKGRKSDKKGGGLCGRRRPSVQAIRDALFKKSGFKGSQERSMSAGGFKGITAIS